jgi:hypothetical protein
MTIFHLREENNIQCKTAFAGGAESRVLPRMMLATVK